MQNIHRIALGQLEKKLSPNKVLLLLGARRTGKTVLLETFIKDIKPNSYLWMNGENSYTTDLLKVRTTENYKRLLGDKKLLIIDEAQVIPEIGLILKYMVDHLKGLKIVATGSSAFDLHNKLGEPLTGRKKTIQLFPLSQLEYGALENKIETKANLEERLIYGSYPELLQYPSNAEKEEYLMEILHSYLLKDILTYEGIRNAGKLSALLKLLAFQVGNEVSMTELGNTLGISKNTAESYMDLLSKVFIIFKVSPFSRNLRNEISKSSKWYFVDNGIRNALVLNFKSLNARDDVGKLWENYLISERIKYQQYTGLLSNNYFWRTYQQQEIDWIEDRGGDLYAYEIKWNDKKRTKVPSAFAEAYPKAKFEVIGQQNYLNWIT